jgi:hypothetical protein
MATTPNTTNFNSPLENFITSVKSGGLAKPNRFKIRIQPPRLLNYALNTARLASMYCEVTNFPFLNLNVKQQVVYGPAYQRPVGMEFGGEGITVTFLLDKDMTIKSFFEEWMFIVVNPTSFNVAYQSDYISEMVISQLDENENEKYRVSFVDVFPRSMNIVELNSTAQNQFHRLSVTFAYRKWLPAAQKR